jgi:hypothetical protein
MRWDQLFDDLEAQASRLHAWDDEQLVADGARSAFAEVALADRLRRMQRGSAVSLGLVGQPAVHGCLGVVGSDWVLVRGAAGESLVPLASVAWLELRPGPGPVRSATASIEARLSIRHALRALARERAYVWVTLVDGHVLAGTVDRVGSDHLELAEHPVDEPRRAAAVRSLRALRVPAIAVVRSAVNA